MGTFTTSKQFRLGANLTGLWWLSGASIDLDLRNGRYYDSGLAALKQPLAAVTDYLSCSRASIGYAKTAAGTLTQFASNVLRITDLGLLIEDSRMNIAKNSGDLTGPSWGPSGATVSTSGTAPDGTSSCLITESAGTNVVHGVFDNTTANWTSGATYAVSFFVKNISGNYCFLNFQGNDANCWISAVFDLTAGAGSATQTAVGATSGTIVSTSIEAWGNGWYRLILVGSFAASGNTAFVEIGSAPAATGNTFNTSGDLLYTVASGGKQLFNAWGMQLEAGSFASSYIPVGTTVAVTRAADVVTTSGGLSTTVNLATASAYIQIGKVPFNPTTDAYGDAFLLRRGNSGQGAAFRLRAFTTSIDRIISMYDQAATTYLDSTPAAGQGYATVDGYKAASAWDGSGRSISAQGATAASDAVIMGASTGDSSVGSSGGTNLFFGYIRRLTVWNSRLADATLQGLTAP